MEVSYLPVSWTDYLDLSHKLAASILQHAPKIHRIVAISRGGLTLGHLLSDALRIPISTISIQSYTDICERGELTITEKLKTDITSQTILLVDDVSDSGKTFIRATTYLKKLKPNRIVTVAMFYKPHSTFRPDFYARQTSKWILFPYEPTEMILNITTSLMKKGKTKNEIQIKLISLGYSESQIKFVRKYHLS